jgi:hypothetical protein
MDTPINRNRIVMAREHLKDALAELDDALAETERPVPQPPPIATKVARKRKSMRRGS